MTNIQTDTNMCQYLSLSDDIKQCEIICSDPVFHSTYLQLTDMATSGNPSSCSLNIQNDFLMDRRKHVAVFSLYR